MQVKGLLQLLALHLVLVVSQGNGCATPTELREKCGHDELLLAPKSNSSEYAAWFATIKSWRSSCQKQLQYNGSIYDRKALQWTRSNFIQPQMHPLGGCAPMAP